MKALFLCVLPLLAVATTLYAQSTLALTPKESTCQTPKYPQPAYLIQKWGIEKGDTILLKFLTTKFPSLVRDANLVIHTSGNQFPSVTSVEVFLPSAWDIKIRGDKKLELKPVKCDFKVEGDSLILTGPDLVKVMNDWKNATIPNHGLAIQAALPHLISIDSHQASKPPQLILTP